MRTVGIGIVVHQDRKRLSYIALLFILHVVPPCMLTESRGHTIVSALFEVLHVVTHCVLLGSKWLRLVDGRGSALTYSPFLLVNLSLQLRCPPGRRWPGPRAFGSTPIRDVRVVILGCPGEGNGVADVNSYSIFFGEHLNPPFSLLGTRRAVGTSPCTWDRGRWPN